MCCPDHVIAHSGPGVACCCLLLNCIFPGVGTMINGCFGRHCCAAFLYGLLQLITACLIIGWIWSIIWGCKILDKSKHPHDPHYAVVETHVHHVYH
mmetsp:Transcript_34813/g.33919  ORF Transcript_34813/g.33919 Transcript_34813/m.33919 type:complete len:96 (-) Transcript_34813:30-317(-)